MTESDIKRVKEGEKEGEREGKREKRGMEGG